MGRHHWERVELKLYRLSPGPSADGGNVTREEAVEGAPEFLLHTSVIAEPHVHTTDSEHFRQCKKI